MQFFFVLKTKYGNTYCTKPTIYPILLV